MLFDIFEMKCNSSVFQLEGFLRPNLLKLRLFIYRCIPFLKTEQNNMFCIIQSDSFQKRWQWGELFQKKTRFVFS